MQQPPQPYSECCQESINNVATRRQNRRRRRSHNNIMFCPTSSRLVQSSRMLQRSSICLIGLLTCAAVIVQAFASTSPNNNLSPWGAKPRGGHVGAKKASASSSSVLSMSTAESQDSRNSSEKKVVIPSAIIRPLSDISDSSDEEDERDYSGATIAPDHKIVKPGKAKKIILESGGFADSAIPVNYVAETKLPTDIGHFRIRAYRIDEAEEALRAPNPLGAGAGLGSEPCVIYCADKPPFGSKGGVVGGAREVPVRIHDQCFTSEVFGSRR